MDFVRVRRNFFHDHVVRRDKQSENTQRFRYGSFEDIHWKVSEFLARRTRQNIIYPASLPLSFYLRVFLSDQPTIRKTNFIIVSLCHINRSKIRRYLTKTKTTKTSYSYVGHTSRFSQSGAPKSSIHQASKNIPLFESRIVLSSRALIVFHSSFDNACNFVLPKQQETGENLMKKSWLQMTQ